MVNTEIMKEFAESDRERVAKITFLSTGDVYMNDSIVNESSFKYTESTNSDDTIKLGFSSSSLFEVNLVGNFIDRTDEEIKVEIISINHETSEPTEILFPVGFFIISDVEYDYNNNFSHITAYSKINSNQTGQDITAAIKVNSFNNYSLSTVFLISNNLDSSVSDYIQRTEPQELDVILDPNTYQDVLVSYDSPIAGNYTCKIKRVYTYQVFKIKVEAAKKLCIVSHTGLENQIYLMQNMRSEIDDDVTAALKELKQMDDYYSLNHSTTISSTCPYNISNFNWYLDENGKPLESKYTSTGTDTYYVKVYVGCDIYYYKSSYSPNTSFPSSVSRWRQYTINNWTIADFPRITIEYLTLLKYKNFNESAYDSNYAKYNSLSPITQGRLFSDFAEVQGAMVRIDRTNGDFQTYSFVDEDLLLPSDNLYPSNELYPNGKGSVIRITKNMYSYLSCRKEKAKRVGKVIAKDNRGIEQSAVVPNFNEEEYSTIVISDSNFFIQMGLISAQIVCNSILDMYKDYTFIPFECECIGIPPLESGDWIAIQTQEGQKILNVSRRTLKGIQGMTDSLSSGSI